ncbi:uncharacterized protein GGS25DRAFT_501539 [Hypoxylon fragiforme]|uniref:uncharacterized protein n=1 Tax=Hypoxylon fragiforme TaxID=63214 RepID=UPI0020C66121|nr:uncharacterized protein GGS25DRAFT_501539 [Hypoxylon fragiforme]KAI2606499.1 hypothetical protein GGS25DRAFT_501539 [Hypoxylon fragiforme]
MPPHHALAFYFPRLSSFLGFVLSFKCIQLKACCIVDNMATIRGDYDSIKWRKIGGDMPSTYIAFNNIVSTYIRGKFASRLESWPPMCPGSDGQLNPGKVGKLAGSFSQGARDAYLII